MEIVARGIVAAGLPGTRRQSLAFPQVCVLPDGRWLCGFRAAPTKTATAVQGSLLCWSDDHGRSWSEPVEPFRPPAIEGRPGQFRAAAPTPLGGPRVLAALCWVDCSNPTLPFFNPATEGLLDTRIFLAQSDDGGATWSAPRLVDTRPFCCPTPLTGPVLLLPGGELGCQFELNKPYDDPSPWRHASVLMFSPDGGRSWPEHTLTSSDPANRVFYWDQRPGVLPDGRILDLFWTYDRQAAAYRNIHARQSHDRGRTWSALWDTGVPGQPAAPVALPGARIGMVYVDRTGPPVIKIRTSADGGRSWPDDTQMVIDQIPASQTHSKATMQDTWAEMEQFSLGLPASALVANGDVLVVYYSGPAADQTDIRWARIHLSE